MNKVANVFVLVFAAGMVVTGLLLGFGNEAGDCGSAFSPADGAGEQCEVLLSDQRQIPLALLGTGATLGLAVLFANGVAPIVPREDRRS